MGIYSTVPLLPERLQASRTRVFVAESVSFASKQGQNVSWRPTDGVPAGGLWLLQSIYAFNGEAAPVRGMFVLIDHEDTDHARFTPAGVAPTEVPAGAALSWTGRLWVPAGWKLGVKFTDMLGGARCHWRYTAVASEEA